MRFRTGCLGLVTIAIIAVAVSRPALAHDQDTGFLNRRITVGRNTYKYQVYLPEQWTPTRKWPVILYLHGRGERGTDGLYQTQVGLAPAIRAHPERWPFIIVMPQAPFDHYWTDAVMMTVAMAALDSEMQEFHGDPDRMYLTGNSMGAYGVWEIAKDYPGRFAAVVPVCGGVFWSYAPQRWKDPGLPATYAARIGRTPVWIFHGAEDTVVLPRQADLMYEALRSAGGRVRYWEYAGLGHDVWGRAYGEPELPHWLLSHQLQDAATMPAYAERDIVPVHPIPAKINPAIYDAYTGTYRDSGNLSILVFRTGDTLFLKNVRGEVNELLPENATTFFYPGGGTMRFTFLRDGSEPAEAIIFRDDRHEEQWPRDNGKPH